LSLHFTSTFLLLISDGTQLTRISVLLITPTQVYNWSITFHRWMLNH
jgi:hypothetical protein